MKKGMLSRLKNGVYASLVGASMVAYGVGCGDDPVQPNGEVVQTAILENFIDVRYSAKLDGETFRKEFKDGKLVDSTKIQGPIYSETLKDLSVGKYMFVARNDTVTVEVPDYATEVNQTMLDSLSRNSNLYYDSTKTFNLQGLATDKNKEQNPVALLEAISDDGKTVPKLSGSQLELKATNPDSTGPFRVRLKFAGGLEAALNGNVATDEIAFWSNKDNQFGQIYLISVNGKVLKRLTSNQFNDGYPSFSPDGKKIVFDTNREDVTGDGRSEFSVYTMDVEGNNQKRLTPNIEHAYSPIWCNGGKIFLNFNDLGFQGIGSINQDGTGFKKIIIEPFSGNLSGRPACSPDGLQIAYVSFRDGNSEVYISNVDGSNPKNITNSPYIEEQPSWSPDGKRIIIRSDRATPGQPNFDLYSIDPDGLNVKNITSGSGSEIDAVWSVDGSKIIFAYFISPITDSNPKLFMMNQDGSGRIQINTNVATRYPSWRPRQKL